MAQRDVAERLGMAGSSYAHWEQGRVAITPVRVSGLAAIFGVATDGLARVLDGEVEPRALRELEAEYSTDCGDLRRALGSRLPADRVGQVADLLNGLAALPVPALEQTLDAFADLLDGRLQRLQRDVAGKS